MSKQIEMDFVTQNITIRANLLWDENSNLCQQFLDTLPYTSIQMHTMVSGKNLYHLLPQLSVNFSNTDKVVSRVNTPPGSLFIYYPRLIMIKYGQDYEDRHFPRIAEVIPEHMQYLNEIGKLCWNNILTKQSPNVIKISRYCRK